MNAKEIAMATGVVAAMAMGGASLMRASPSAPVSAPSAGAAASVRPPASPPKPDACKALCAADRPQCPAVRGIVNCPEMLHYYERETADSGHPFTCETANPQPFLDSLGWCPNHGEEKPIRGMK